MKAMRLLFLVALVLGCATGAAAQPRPPELYDSQEPGSVLVFPKFTRGLNDHFAATRFEISVVCPTGQRCWQHQPVHLRGHWVCPPAEGSNVCGETDFSLDTTVWGTVTFTPETTEMLPPCDEEGYLIVWVVDEFGTRIKFDGLIGDLVERDSSTAVYALHALPIQAAPSLASGASTEINSNGQVNFDGVEYQKVTGTVIAPIRFDAPFNNNTPPTWETALTLLTLDVRSSSSNFPTEVGLHFYSADEVLVSTYTTFSCWAEIELEKIPGMDTLNADNPNWTEKGIVRSTYAGQNGSSVTLLGYVETSEYDIVIGEQDLESADRQYAYWMYNDSVPVPTIFCISPIGCRPGPPVD